MSMNNLAPMGTQGTYFIKGPDGQSSYFTAELRVLLKNSRLMKIIFPHMNQEVVRAFLN